MSWDYVPGKNAEGYPDPTAAAALSNVQRSQRGLQSKRAGEHFENMIAASLSWYKDKGVAFIEKTPPTSTASGSRRKTGRRTKSWATPFSSFPPIPEQ